MAASSSERLPLRRLQPAPLPVDLDVKRANLARKSQQLDGHARHKLDLLSEMPTQELQRHKSPYRQHLRRPKSPAPSPGSPAQRAAKSILKIKEGLLRLDATKWILDDEETANTLPRERLTPSSPSAESAHNLSSKTTSLGNSRARSQSPARAKTPQRSPSRKKKKRPPTREERELAEKQARLAEWLKANPDVSPANIIQGDGRWRSRVDGTPFDTTSLYSTEVEARIEAAMRCQGPLESGVRLWDDPVRSLIAAEMTSESVFGGLVPTRALAFMPPQPSSPSRLLLAANEEALLQPLQALTSAQTHNNEENREQMPEAAATSVNELEMSDLAQKVFTLANRQAADGAVADALATLEAGIHRSLSISQARLDAVSCSDGAGFDYSAQAHDSATKLQIFCRVRHRRRVNTLILLQRQWRWWNARRKALDALQLAQKQAKVIQRRYRGWHTRITQVRSAVRIQRCFRVFASQKFLVRFHKLCRLLMARQARRRQVKARMRTIGRIVFAWRKRRRRIALVQGLWRRRCAHAQLVSLLAHVSAVELGRRAREDEIVAANLAQAKLLFRTFLSSTKPGRKLVHWQAEKPWIRFRRLRHNTRQWEQLPLPERLNAVVGVLSGCIFRGLARRALCQMLVGRNEQVPAFPKELKVSTEALSFLATPPVCLHTPKLFIPVGCCACCPWWSSVRDKLRVVHGKLSRRAATMWWKIVTFPKEYCSARMWPMRGRRRKQAQQQIEDDFTRVLTAFLRVWFRRLDSKMNTPPYACEWCAEPFSTSRKYFAHGKCATARARAEAEWTALSGDLHFVQRKNLLLSKQTNKAPDRPESYALDLEPASVRRLRGTCSRRKALVTLVTLLETCTASDSSNAVIPLELVGFVLRNLDVSKDWHPLMQTAEHQLVQWSALIGSMAVESSSALPQESTRESRWVRRDELRARLIVGGRWRGVWNRWRRRLDRSLKYRPLRAPLTGTASVSTPPGSRLTGAIAAKWAELQLRLRRLVPSRTSKAAVHTPLSPAGARVLPVAT